MNTRKKEIRDIIDRIIDEPAGSPVHSFEGLKVRVIAALNPQSESARASEETAAMVYSREPHEPDLSPDDWALLSEIYWDLIVDRIITPGLDAQNREFCRFRIHSEYVPRLKGPA